MALRIVNTEGVPFDASIRESLQIDAGKTKLVYPHREGILAVLHRDIITANDNPIYTGNAVGKGTASAYSTALLFKRIEEMGIPTSHVGILNSNTTLDRRLEMLPFEIIWRRYNVAGNSWMKRNPTSAYQVGERYDEIIYEACLKWSVKTTDGKVVHDPFLVLDDNFIPQLRDDGMPRLMDSKTNKELDYAEVLHPNKGSIMSDDQVKEAIADFSEYSSDIRQMAEGVQQVTFDTYAQIGRLNADGKIEVGVHNGKLLLGDELELDSLRNISLSTAELRGMTTDTISFGIDTLGYNLNEIIDGGANGVQRIVTSRHSGKQVYREHMMKVDEMVKAYGENPTLVTRIRKALNDVMAQDVTDNVYAPVALALSNRFGKEVGYLLQP